MVWAALIVIFIGSIASIVTTWKDELTEVKKVADIKAENYEEIIDAKK